MPHNTPDETGRLRGLNGLRAVAAGLVLLYHLVPGIVPIGFVGVDVFFVISGFLITALLMREWANTGKISIVRFWKRRFLRLFPAVAVATVGTLALARILGGDSLVQLRWQTLGSLTGTYNWFQVANSSSYFNHQSPLVLTNMWSLAVEQQFYLVWPFIVIGLLAFAGRRFQIGFAAVLGIASATLHVVLTGSDVTRSYVGTDTHAFGLMIGALVALALPGIMNGTRERSSRYWGIAAWVALALLILGTLLVPENTWMYPWGMIVASALTAFIIRGMLPDVDGIAGRTLARVLDCSPLYWLGERSYGIYLWHWPLWVFLYLNTKISAHAMAAIVLALSIVIADLSYRYVETPIRRHGFGAFFSRFTGRTAHITATTLTACLLVACCGLVTSKPMSTAEELVAQGQKELEEAQTQVPSSAPSENPTPAQSPAAQTAPEPQPQESKIPVTGDRVTVIGDSVTLASAKSLLATLPGVMVDAKVSRFPWDFADVVATSGMRDYLVISLATNGEIDSRIAHVMMGFAGDRKVVFVNGFGPGRATWIPKSNATLQEIAAEYPEQVRIADWNSYAAAHQDQLADDHIHPKSEASQAYAQIIVDALNSF